MENEEPLRRPDLFVVARILERLRRNGAPMLKTRLQVAGRVNYDIFSRYLRWMLDRGLVSLEGSESNETRVSLTSKGLEAYEHLAAWLDRFVRDMREARPR